MRFLKTKVFVYFMVILLASTLVLTGCGQSGGKTEKDNSSQPKEEKKKVVIKITHGVGTDSVFQHTSEKFKELVGAYSNGQVEVQIYPGSQLGSAEKSVQDIQQGIIEATIESVNNYSPFAPTFGMFDLPYLVESSEEFNKAIDAMADKLNEKITKESGLRAITWFEQGPRVLGTKTDKPIETIDDLQGLKIRVPKNPMMLGAFQSWGVNATPIAWDETINAVQQGVIDGLELPYGDFYSTNLYEMLKYITEIHYKYDVGAIVVKEEWLQSQPEDIRNAIIKAGKETTEWARDFNKDFLNKAKEQMKGKVTLSPTPKDEAVWIEKAKADWPKYYDKVGGKETVSALMDVLGKKLP
ncbi:MAG: TRAP transporter substrate-binding protein [Bacillota bacterium]